MMPVTGIFGKTDCNVNVTVVDESDGSELFKLGQIEVDPLYTPILFNVSPNKGGTEGGTRVTLSGMNFGTNETDVAVSIHGVGCVVKSVSDTKVVCETEPYHGPRLSTQPVMIIGTGRGKAVYSNDASTQFWYIDRWSSPFSWGCANDTCHNMYPA